MTEIDRWLEPVVGDDAPADWKRRLGDFVAFLRERNEVVNLVSRRSIDVVVEQQVLPSLAALLVVPPRRRLRIVDVGSGGGLPAIPLKILRPDVSIQMVEARRKKVEFLRDAIDHLGLKETEAHWARIETSPPAVVERAPFDLLLSRAMGNDAALRKAMRTLGYPAAWVFDAPAESRHVLSHPELGELTGLRQL